MNIHGPEIGHHVSLLGVSVLEGTPHVVTADISGVFKLWDIRTFECLQTFEASAPPSELSAFIADGPHNQIIFGGTYYEGTRMTLFEYDKPGAPWLSMEHDIIAALFSSASSTIVTRLCNIPDMGCSNRKATKTLQQSMCQVRINQRNLLR